MTTPPAPGPWTPAPAAPPVPAWPTPAAPGPWPAPGPVGGNGVYCGICGSTPAVAATFRSHQGLIVLMRFLRRRGNYCRDCGVATFRQMTAASLWQGWWGILSLLINPVTMLVNLVERAKVAALAPPVPGAPGQPMPPGAPLYRRPAILGLLVPVALAAALIAAVAASSAHDPEYADIGDCIYDKNVSSWRDADAKPDVARVSCTDPRAQARVVAKLNDVDGDHSVCDSYPEADAGFHYQHGSTRYTLCVRVVK